MDFRLISEEHEETVKWLWAYCFEDHEPFFSWYFREYYQRENTLGAIDAEGRLLSCLQLIPYEIFLRGQGFATSYVVGVASLPEARRGGLVGKLLKAAVEEMNQRKQAVSLLMPFQGQFYYPYQWSFCYFHHKYVIPIQDLKRLSEPAGDFLPLHENEKIECLNEIYQVFVQGRNGYVIRDEEKWRLILEEHYGEKGSTYLLENLGEPQGYILYYLKDNKLIVREIAYKNIQAQKALFDFIYNHRSQVETLEWHAPIDDDMHLFLPDPTKGITLYPFLMARIINVQKALEMITYTQHITDGLIIKVEDSLAEWNNQHFAIKINSGSAQVSATTQEPDVIIGIDALTQLIFGTLSAQKLLYQQRISIRETNYAQDTRVVTLLDEMFPPCNNYINEYY